MGVVWGISSMENVADVKVAVPKPVERSTKAMPVRLLTGAKVMLFGPCEPVPFVCTHSGSKKVPPFWMQAVT